MLELNTLYNMDCMEGMKEFPDKFFELAIVDPPYGGGCNSEAEHDHLTGGGSDWETKKRSRFGGIFDKYNVERTGGTWAAKYDSKIKHWDIAPPPEYFAELARVSKNQIIWGGNYFDLPPTRCFIVWRKTNIPEAFSMAMCEYAWTSLNQNAKIFEGNSQDKDRFHPTQKPVALYSWCLNQFAKPGDKILDTHAGSASSLIACHKGGYEYIGFEIDEGYFAKANERLNAEKAQVSMFGLAEKGLAKQEKLLEV